MVVACFWWLCPIPRFDLHLRLHLRLLCCMEQSTLTPMFPLGRPGAAISCSAPTLTYDVALMMRSDEDLFYHLPNKRGHYERKGSAFAKGIPIRLLLCLPLTRTTVPRLTSRSTRDTSIASNRDTGAHATSPHVACALLSLPAKEARYQYKLYRLPGPNSLV